MPVMNHPISSITPQQQHSSDDVVAPDNSVLTSSSSSSSSPRMNTTEYDSSSSSSRLQRPIVIGYAFGKRKTKSMGAVMRKASKTISSVLWMPTTPHTTTTSTTTASKNINAIFRKPEEKETKPGIKNAENEENTTVVTEDESSFGTSSYQSSSQRRSDNNGMPVLLSCNNRLLHSSTDDRTYNESSSSTPNEEVRSTHSSSSTKASNPPPAPAASGIASLSSSSPTTDLDKQDVDSTTQATCRISDNDNSQQTQQQQQQQQQPIPVSIVPLDLNIPIEDQYGGNFDVILHKLTEDILCKYLSPEERAIQRLQRLTTYKLNHPSCCILDHPNNVQAVFSRCDIACTLSECLKGATSKSGVPVRTPRFHVVLRDLNCSSNNNNKEMIHSHSRRDDIGMDDDDTNGGGSGDISSGGGRSREEDFFENDRIVDDVTTQINNGLFNYPLIVKPLTAAGTVESHEMAVVWNQNGLKKLHSPCFLQEYANHDERLFKVFVLGNKTWVFPRSSLPNLPSGEELLVESSVSDVGIIEFDSQKPYPKASDFAPSRTIPLQSSDDDCTCSNDNTAIPHVSVSQNLEEGDVTAEEMQPIADCLRRAFGLELFGFDVIVVQNYQSKSKPMFRRKQIFVIDVNYFPSYKEVDNFPKVLATYLTKCAIEGRMRSFD